MDPVQRHAELEQRALDGRHEGARAAQVELGIALAADQPLHARGVEEAVAHVERVHDLEAAPGAARASASSSFSKMIERSSRFA